MYNWANAYLLVREQYFDGRRMFQIEAGALFEKNNGGEYRDVENMSIMKRLLM